MAAEEPEVRVAAMHQRWRDVGFASWPVVPAAIADRVLDGLVLDTLDGWAWLSLVVLRIDAEAPFDAPGLPRVEDAAQATLRTYVRGVDGEPAIQVFSADVSSRALAVGGRATQLPYIHSSVSVERPAEDRRRCMVEREDAGADLELEIGEWLPAGAQTVLDRFLVRRHQVYSGLGPALLRTTAEHPPWSLRRARVLRLEESLTRAAHLPALRAGQGPGLVAHWSDGVDVRLGVPAPVVLPRRGS